MIMGMHGSGRFQIKPTNNKFYLILSIHSGSSMFAIQFKKGKITLLFSYNTEHCLRFIKPNKINVVVATNIICIWPIIKKIKLMIAIHL